MQIQDPWSCYDGWGQWTCYLQLWGTRERRVADLVGPALGGGGAHTWLRNLPPDPDLGQPHLHPTGRRLAGKTIWQ